MKIHHARRRFLKPSQNQCVLVFCSVIEKLLDSFEIQKRKRIHKIFIFPPSTKPKNVANAISLVRGR